MFQFCLPLTDDMRTFITNTNMGVAKFEYRFRAWLAANNITMTDGPAISQKEVCLSATTDPTNLWKNAVLNKSPQEIADDQQQAQLRNILTALDGKTATPDQVQTILAKVVRNVFGPLQ
jgi:hypothetical protein